MDYHSHASGQPVYRERLRDDLHSGLKQAIPNGGVVGIVERYYGGLSHRSEFPD
jgi:hypothetical protein